MNYYTQSNMLHIINLIAIFLSVTLLQITSIHALTTAPAPLNWTQLASITPLGKRYDSAYTYAYEQLVILGGIGGTARDVWTSVDGITYEQRIHIAPWSSRQSFDAVTYHNTTSNIDTIYIDGPSGDIWSTTDNGIQWKQLTANAYSNENRLFGCMVVMPETEILYQIGGISSPYNSDNSHMNNDIYTSIDGGITWSLIIPTTNIFSPRYGHRCLVDNITGQIILTGGKDGVSNVWLSDVWSTYDGIVWQQLNSDAFIGRQQHGLIQNTYGTLFIIAGEGSDSNGYGEALHDVYISTDSGVTWIRQPDAPFVPRYNSMILCNENNIIYVICGETTTSMLSDVWSVNSTQFDSVTYDNVPTHAPTSAPSSTATPSGPLDNNLCPTTSSSSASIQLPAAICVPYNDANCTSISSGTTRIMLPIPSDDLPFNICQRNIFTQFGQHLIDDLSIITGANNQRFVVQTVDIVSNMAYIIIDILPYIPYTTQQITNNYRSYAALVLATSGVDDSITIASKLASATSTQLSYNQLQYIQYGKLSSITQECNDGTFSTTCADTKSTINTQLYNDSIITTHNIESWSFIIIGILSAILGIVVTILIYCIYQYTITNQQINILQRDNKRFGIDDEIVISPTPAAPSNNIQQ